MKPDGVATAAAEPMEAVGAEQAPPPSRPGEGEKQQQPALNAEAAPPVSKPGDAKAKAKGPVKARPAATKAPGSGTGSRPGVALGRTLNGVQNGVAKKAGAPTAEKKKPPANATATAAAPKKPAGAAAAKVTKVADRKPAGPVRPATAPPLAGGVKAARATPQPSKKPPVGPSDAVKAKPKTTASKPPSAAVAAAAAAKQDKATVSKTTRPMGGPPAARPASTAATKVAASSTRPASSRVGPVAPPAGRIAVVQPAKPAASAKKDVTKPTSAPPKKAAAPLTRPAATKAFKNELPKSGPADKLDPAAKRPAPGSRATDAKPSRPKPQEIKPRDSAASPRAAGPRPGLGKTASPSPRKPVGSSAPMPVRRGPKPTQSVQPLAAGGEPAKMPEGLPPVPAAVPATTEPQLLVEKEQETVPVTSQPERQPSPVPVELLLTPSVDSQGTETAPPCPAGLSPPTSPSGPAQTHTPPDGLQQPSAVLAAVPGSPVQGEEPWKGENEQVVLVEAEGDLLIPRTEAEGDLLIPRTDAEGDFLIPRDLAAGEAVNWTVEPEPLVALSSELPIAMPKSLAQEREEAIEKADEEINEDEDEVEEDKEGSQQVSLSEMSGTQPTEESRPGSAGLAGSVWRAGALLSELDSEEVSCSQQGASELSAPGVLEGTESMDDLGEASLKGADGEEASVGSPDIETVPEIPANEEGEDEDDEDDEEEDRVYDMEVGSERAEDPCQARRQGEDEEEDEDVEMASEGVTESGLESYGNADEDDFADEDRLDNLNRAQPPPLLPTAPAAQWGQVDPFADPWALPPQPAATLLASPSSDHWAADPETPTQPQAEPWLQLAADPAPQVGDRSPVPKVVEELPAAPAAVVPEESPSAGRSLEPQPPPARGMSQSSTLSGTELAARSSSETSTPEELRDYNSSSGVESLGGKRKPDVEQELGIHLEQADMEEEEAETLPADEVLGGPPTAPTSAPSSPSISGDEASDTEGEMLLNNPEGLGAAGLAFHDKAHAQKPAALAEREEDGEAEEDGDTPQSANSVASYGFDSATSNSNAHSTQSPGIFSLENEDQLPEEAKDPSLIKELTLPAAGDPVDLLPLGPPGEEQQQPNPDEQQYMLCGKPGLELVHSSLSAAGGGGPHQTSPPSSPQHAGEGPDAQPPYYSAICEKTDNVLAGGCESNGRPLARQKEESQKRAAPSKNHCQLRADQVTPLRLPANLLQAAPSVQLRRLEQHKRQLQHIQQRQREEEEEDEDERQRQEQQRELEKQRQELLQLQLHFKHQQQEQKQRQQQEQKQRQQQEQKQRQQILQWQQELEEQQQQQQKAQPAVLLSPSSGLCTIFETMEVGEEEEEQQEENVEPGYETAAQFEETVAQKKQEDKISPFHRSGLDFSDPTQQQLPVSLDDPQNSPSGDLPQLDLDWGQKVDIVQKLINQTLLLAGDGCPPLLLLPGGGGGTLSPLETSLWPALLPPLTPPSATVTSVSSFSPEDQGSSPQGEWTVVELETHH